MHTHAHKQDKTENFAGAAARLAGRFCDFLEKERKRKDFLVLSLRKKVFLVVFLLFPGGLVFRILHHETNERLLINRS